MPRKHPYVSRRVTVPHPGERSQKQNPGAKNAPREREGLCEKVSQNVCRWGSARAANSVCSLPRSRGRVGERASKRESSRVPPPYPSPASGGGETPRARGNQRGGARPRREGPFGGVGWVVSAPVPSLESAWRSIYAAS